MAGSSRDIRDPLVNLAVSAQLVEVVVGAEMAVVTVQVVVVEEVLLVNRG
jgi:hypothetical protein